MLQSELRSVSITTVKRALIHLIRQSPPDRQATLQSDFSRNRISQRQRTPPSFLRHPLPDRQPRISQSDSHSDRHNRNGPHSFATSPPYRQANCSLTHSDSVTTRNDAPFISRQPPDHQAEIAVGIARIRHTETRPFQFRDKPPLIARGELHRITRRHQQNDAIHHFADSPLITRRMQSDSLGSSQQKRRPFISRQAPLIARRMQSDSLGSSQRKRRPFIARQPPPDGDFPITVGGTAASSFVQKSARTRLLRFDSRIL